MLDFKQESRIKDIQLKYLNRFLILVLLSPSSTSFDYNLRALLDLKVSVATPLLFEIILQSCRCYILAGTRIIITQGRRSN